MTYSDLNVLWSNAPCNDDVNLPSTCMQVSRQTTVTKNPPATDMLSEKRRVDVDNVSFDSNAFKTLTEQADQSQLQNEISNLLQDKQTLANVALNHFSQWDKDKDEALSVTELSQIETWELSAQERAAARILAKNFDAASNLSSAVLPQEVEQLSWGGRDFMQSAFAGDSKDGISRNDLNVIASVSKENGLAKMTHDLVQGHKHEAGFHGALSGAGGVLALFYLLKMATHKGGVFMALQFLTQTIAATVNAKIAVDAVNNKDEEALKELFEDKEESVKLFDV